MMAGSSHLVTFIGAWRLELEFPLPFPSCHSSPALYPVHHTGSQLPFGRSFLLFILVISLILILTRRGDENTTIFIPIQACIKFKIPRKPTLTQNSNILIPNYKTSSLKFRFCSCSFKILCNIFPPHLLQSIHRAAAKNLFRPLACQIKRTMERRPGWLQFINLSFPEGGREKRRICQRVQRLAMLRDWSV